MDTGDRAHRFIQTSMSICKSSGHVLTYKALVILHTKIAWLRSKGSTHDCKSVHLLFSGYLLSHILKWYAAQ